MTMTWRSRACLNALAFLALRAPVVADELTVLAAAKVAFDVPTEQGPAIVYPQTPITGSKRAATEDLVRHLLSARAREVYGRHGFAVLAER